MPLLTLSNHKSTIQPIQTIFSPTRLYLAQSPFTDSNVKSLSDATSLLEYKNSDATKKLFDLNGVAQKIDLIIVALLL